MSLDLRTEICVVGGGPAGTTVARRLALLGHQVSLLEREIFPRSHIGESISPGILPLLEILGVRSQIEEAGFYRPRRTFVQWGSKEVLVKDFAGQAGFQVDRGRFDNILLRAAEEAGVKVIQPAFAAQPLRTKDEKWRVPVHSGNQLLQFTADFLIDAAGRRSVLKKRKKKYSPDTLALYGYWKGVKLDGVESRVETGKKEWFWGAPLPDGTFNAAVFLDSHRLRKEQVKASGLKDSYCSLLKESKLLQVCLDGELVSRVRACDASTYLSEDFVDYNSIKVGEASCAIDPLSSQGVQAAIHSGLQAAIVVHTLLTNFANREAAIKFYEERQKESVLANLRYAGKFYSEAMPYRSSGFWSKRAVPEIEPPELNVKSAASRSFSMQARLRFAAEAQMILTPCITGDIIQEMPALVSASLERPAAFLNEIPVAEVWNSVSSGKRVAEIVKEMETRYAGKNILNVIKWLLSRNILNVSDEIER